MKRGEIWTLAGGSPYASKPRPVVIIQNDQLAETDSIVVCSFTTTLTGASLLRIRVDPSLQNGLRQPSDVMVEKIAGVPRERLGRRIGDLESNLVERVVTAIHILVAAASNDIR